MFIVYVIYFSFSGCFLPTLVFMHDVHFSFSFFLYCIIHLMLILSFIFLQVDDIQEEKVIKDTAIRK